MILFFKTPQQSIIATQVDHQLNPNEVKELCWLYGDAKMLDDEMLKKAAGGVCWTNCPKEAECPGHVCGTVGWENFKGC